MAHAARPEGSERAGAIPPERWVLLEARVDQLLQRIRPNQHSEARRVRVADYVRGLVNRCFKLEARASARVASARPISAPLRAARPEPRPAPRRCRRSCLDRCR
jgi:hypothetical protein